LDAEEARTGVRSSHKADAESARAAIGSDGLSCQHCGKTGHQAAKCWKITACTVCGKCGHNPRWCKSGKKRHPNTTETKTCPVDEARVIQLIKESVQAALDGDLNERSTSHYFCSNIPSSTDHARLLLVADSAASKHMSSDSSNATNYHKHTKGLVQVADDRVVPVSGQLRKRVTFLLENDQTRTEELELLHVPDMGRMSLMSVAESVRGGRGMLFDESGCYLYSDASHDALQALLSHKQLLAIGDLHPPGLYAMRIRDSSQPFDASNDASACSAAYATTLLQYHQRLGHRYQRDVRKIVGSLVDGATVVGPQDASSCSMCPACSLGKMKRHPLPKRPRTLYRLRDLLELVHTDVCGPFPVMSIEGAYYFITFIEDRSRMRFTYLMRRKSEVLNLWRRFKRMIERQTGRIIKTLRYDNAAEHLCVEMQQDLRDEGIVSQRTCPYNSNQNQVAEKSNGTLMDAARAMLAHARLPKQFWGAAVMTG
jgi:hypothetical protein